MSKEKLKKPDRKSDTRREGKKSIDWKEDPEILLRLVKVAELMNQNKRSFEIASECGYSIATAKRDIARVREWWKEDAEDRLKNSVDIAIAQYGSIIQQTWSDIKGVPNRSPVRPAMMNVILRAQERIDKVTGIGGDKVEHSGPNGAPIPVEVTNMEALRAKRWKQIAPSLADLKTQEPNATESNAAKKP